MVRAPASPSSIPLILACRALGSGTATIKIFSNHSQAHALFLQGDSQILATGLSVGVRFYRQGAPVQVVNAYVTGLTYLVALEKIDSLGDLRGKTLHLPFAGSPIDEVTRFFVSREGLVWNRDIRVAHTRFPATLKLLREGRIFAAALPEPFVSMIRERSGVYVSIGFRDLWENYTGGKEGYPQVATLVKKDWAEDNADLIRRLNREVDRAVAFVRENPDEAAAQTQGFFSLPEGILRSALRRTDFRFLADPPLKREIETYYRTIGRPLDEGFQDFFYTAPE